MKNTDIKKKQCNDCLYKIYIILVYNQETKSISDFESSYRCLLEYLAYNFPSNIENSDKVFNELISFLNNTQSSECPYKNVIEIIKCERCNQVLSRDRLNCVCDTCHHILKLDDAHVHNCNFHFKRGHPRKILKQIEFL